MADDVIAEPSFTGEQRRIFGADIQHHLFPNLFNVCPIDPHRFGPVRADFASDPVCRSGQSSAETTYQRRGAGLKLNYPGLGFSPNFQHNSIDTAKRHFVAVDKQLIENVADQIQLL
jgi:hypothetical protein